MKISLRNFVLAAAVLVAGSTFAETPTVTQKWKYTLTSPTVPTQLEARYASAVNGKIYFRDKANKKIKYLDSTGTVTELCSVNATGPAIAVDEAGNILVNDGWSGAASGSKFVLVSADGKTQKAFTYTADGFTNTRTDQLGRAVGDFFSEEGGYLFVAENSNCYLVQIKNGELVTSGLKTYQAGTFSSPATGTSTLAQSMYSFSELKNMGNDAVKGFAIRNRSAKSVFYGFDGTKFKSMTQPTGANTQEGFDVFSLDGVDYQVVPIKGKSSLNYSDEFVIADSKGTIIYKEENLSNKNTGYSTQYQTFNARKVSDYKVELYVWQSMNFGITFAMYEITIPEPQVVTLPEVYLRGGINGWAAGDAYKFTPVIAEGATEPAPNANGEYEMKLYVDRLNGEFKLGDATANFETFNYGYASGEVKNGGTVEMKSGWGNNVNMGSVDLMHVNLTFYYNPDAAKSSWLKIEGEDYDPEYVVLPDVYLRGDVSNWAVSNSFKMTPVIEEGHRYPIKNANGEYQYTLSVDRLYGNFKLGGKAANWSDFNYGADGDSHVFGSEDATLKAWPGSSVNFELGDMILDDVKVNFFYNADNSPSWLQITGKKLENHTDKAHFTYGLSMEFDNVHGIYHFSFKSTGAAPQAYLVATPVATGRAGAETVTIDLGPVIKGENKIDLYDTSFEYMTNYTWAIELHNYEVPYTKVVFAAKTPVSTITSNKNQGAAARGSVIPMVDDQYPSYGYTVVGHNWDLGFDIYNPEGELVEAGVHKNNTLLYNATKQAASYNISNGLRGTEHRGHVLIAAWGDDAHGVVAFDPLNLDEPMYSVFEGEKDNIGIITNNGVKVGSGTPCVAVYGKDDNAVLYTFDEDILNNNIAKYNIGAKRTVATAPFNVGYGGKLTNTNVEIAPVKEGIFVSQIRSEGLSRNTKTPGLMFVSNETINATSNEPNLKAADWYVSQLANQTILTGANSALAVNKDETLLAVSSGTKIHVMNLSFDNGKPVMTEKETISLPASTGWGTMHFDAANNLHYYAIGTDANHGYRIYALANKQPVVRTNAPDDAMLLVTTGVEDIDVDVAGQQEAVYYNLNGVRMDGASLTPGVYVKVTGNATTKVVVK